MSRRYLESESSAVNGDAGVRPCDHPGCSAEGAYRAPRSPRDLRRYYWFCLEHVRAYNAAWDFFADMTEEEIEAFRRDDVTGHRPTWPVGIGVRFQRLWASPAFADLFGVLYGDGGTPKGDADPAAALPASERDALAVLNLGATATLAEIKGRFKELAKRYHPDVNHGDKAAEERLKLVIEAYRYLIGRRTS